MFEFPVSAPSAYVAIQAAPPLAALLGGIVHFPPDQRNLSYKELTCTDKDKANIFELISTMAKENEINLLLERTHLKQIGAQISHVHPLKFLSTIYTNPQLKSGMPALLGNYFTRTNLLQGLGANLSREADKGTLDKHLPDFATELKLPVDVIRSFTATRDWEGLVNYLTQQP